jgi:hypothetical protein
MVIDKHNAYTQYITEKYNGGSLTPEQDYIIKLENATKIANEIKKHIETLDRKSWLQAYLNWLCKEDWNSNEDLFRRKDF